MAELSRANERLREIERLRTEFYRNISHELATPMTPIVGYLRMLLDEELGAAQQAADQGAARDGRLRAAPARRRSTTSST